MRISFCVTTAAYLCLFVNGNLFADHLPPVDPILDGTDHSHEDHSAHDHWNDGIGPNNIGQVSNVNLSDSSFVNALLRNNSISDSLFINADLTGTDLDDARFNNCDFRGATINTTMGEATWNDSDLRGATFLTTGMPPEFNGQLNGLYIRSNLSGQDFTQYFPL